MSNIKTGDVLVECFHNNDCFEAAEAQSSTLFQKLKLILGYPRLRDYSKQPIYLLSGSSDGHVRMWQISLPSSGIEQQQKQQKQQKQHEVLTLSKSFQSTTQKKYDVDIVLGPYRHHHEYHQNDSQQQLKQQLILASTSQCAIMTWDIVSNQCTSSLQLTSESIGLAWWYNSIDGILYLITGDFVNPHGIYIRQWEYYGNNSNSSIEQGKIVKQLFLHKNSLRRFIVLYKNEFNNQPTPTSQACGLANDSLLSCSDDGKVILSDLVTGATLRVIEPSLPSPDSDAYIYFMCRIIFSHKSQPQLYNRFPLPTLIACTIDTNVEIWDFATGERHCIVHDAHEKYISSVLYSQSLNLLVTSASDKYVTAWKIELTNVAAEDSTLKCTQVFSLQGPNDSVCRKMAFLDRSDYGNGSNSGMATEGGRYVVVGQDESMFVVDLKLEAIVQNIEKAHGASIWNFGLI